MFEGYVEGSKFYSPRGPVLIGISKVMLLNYRVVKNCTDIDKTDKDKIREITIALEKELYFKN